MKAACTARPATVRGRAERGIGRSKLEQIARYGVLLGSRGHIYRDGSGWLLYVRCRSGMHWTWTKKRLAFCRLTQDGDDEGCLHLDRLPSAAEADEIRRVIGLHQTTPPRGVSARHMPRISFHL